MGNKSIIAAYLLLFLVIGVGLALIGLPPNTASLTAPQKVAVPTTASLLAQFKSIQANFMTLVYNLNPSDGPLPAEYLNPKIVNAADNFQVQAEIVASSTDDIFSYPHGTIVVGNKIAIGTVKENPARITIFTDPYDLTKYITTSTPGFMNLADVGYDISRHRLYFVSSRTDNNHLEILSVDPDTLAWVPVFEFSDIADIGYSTIRTDGTYVYVATQSIPSYMIKVRISDWSLQMAKLFLDGPGFHSSALHEYSDRTEWYVTTFSIPTIFFKVNTGDLSYTSTTLAHSGDVTDDIYFRAIDDQGGLLYTTSESIFGTDVINTENMSSSHYETLGSYGLFSDGIDLYSADAHDHQIIRYPNFKIQEPAFIKLSNSSLPNELFRTPDGNTYFTDFGDPSALYQYFAVSPD